MKRRDLIKILTDMGCLLVRHGAKHDWYMNAQTRRTQPVPRHNEINEAFSQIHYQEAKG